MLDTDPEFDRQVRLLSEAGRIDPVFGATILEAKTDADIDRLIGRAEAIVEEQADGMF